MVSLGKRRERDPAVVARLPPGQELTTKWPVLHYGSVPRVDLATWDFCITGLVEQPVRFTWEEFMALPQTRRHNDIHFCERNGYHMRGDPWNEERYSAWW
jgi:DMSO/TMAO reductase YedYZ molybdopterin-dependent catalytic subunit